MTDESQLARTEPTPKVRLAAESMADHLNGIAKLFKSGVKITLLVRNPAHPERNAFLTDETDMDAVIEAIRQLHTSPSGAVFDV